MPYKQAAVKYLLFDDKFIGGKEGVHQNLEKPVRRDGPHLLPDKPWESAGIRGDSGMSVIEHGGEYKLWYTLSLGDPDPRIMAELENNIFPGNKGHLDRKILADYISASQFMLCYAVSRDGTNWEKPELGLIEYEGSRNNNIVLIARLGATVFIDHVAPRSERFKIIYGGGPRLEHINLPGNTSPGRIYHAIYGAHSPDGIHWTPYPRPIIPWYTDTTNVCYLDDEKNKYSAFVRWKQGVTYSEGKTFSEKHDNITRAIGRTESRDFSAFPPPVKILEPALADSRPYESGFDYYNSAAMKYPYAPESYFLFISSYYHYSDMLDVHLAASRDGINYSVWDEPFVPLGPEGSFDSRMIYMAAGAFRKDNEIWMYYAGYENNHGYYEQPGSYSRFTGRLGRVSFRMDGFISQCFSGKGGLLTTVPIKFGGDSIRVNADSSAGGELKLELLDESCAPIPGFTAAECEHLFGNYVDRTVKWKGEECLRKLNNRSIRLRFTGKATRLYSFSFCGPGNQDN